MASPQATLKKYAIPLLIIISFLAVAQFYGLVDIQTRLFSFVGIQIPIYEDFDDGSIGADLVCQRLNTAAGESTNEVCTTDKFKVTSDRFEGDNAISGWLGRSENLILWVKSAFSTRQFNNVFFQTTQNLRGNYIEMRYSRLKGEGTFRGGLKTASGPLSEIHPVQPASCEIIPTSSGAGVAQPLGGILRCFASDLDSSKYRCEDGTKEIFCEFPPEQPIQLWFWLQPGSSSTEISIPEVRTRPARGCALEQNDYVAVETFRGGQDIDKFSTRYFVKKYCDELPVVITDPNAAFTTLEPYITWSEGGKTTIPLEETWTVYYIFENLDSEGNTLTSTICDFSQEVYDVPENKCIPRGGIVQICSEGIFDPERQQCVTEPITIIAEPLAQQEGITIEEAAAQVTEACEGTLIRNPDGSVTCNTPVPVNQLCAEGTINTIEGTCEAPDPTPCSPGETRKEISTGQFSCVKSVAPANPAKAITRQIVITTSETFGLSQAQAVFVLILIAIAIWAVAAGKIFKRR